MPHSNQPTSRLYLAIDQGGQSSRVAVYSDLGEQVCCFVSPCDTRTYVNAQGDTCIEQDGSEILTGIKEGLAQVTAFLGKTCSGIQAAGFAGQGSSFLSWNHHTGQPLSPVLSWQDCRAQKLLHDFPLSAAEVHARTGLRISPHYGASKMQWCLQHLPALQAARDNRTQLCVGPIVSYLFRHLLVEGAQASPVGNLVDPGHAQRTLLWNLHTQQWDPDLLEAFAIPSDILPQCRWHNSHMGYLPLGGQHIPFCSTQRDQGASLFARGMPDRDSCYVNLGTGAFVQCISQELRAPEGLLTSPLWLPDPQGQGSSQNLYAWEATVNGAASALQWLAGETGMTVIEPAHIGTALQLNPSSPCYCLNAVGGLGAPFWRTDLISRFSGELAPLQKILAWIESVLFHIAVNIQLMNSAKSLKKIIISGGLSQADDLCQRLADLTGLVVLRSDNPDATLQGVAYTAAGMPEQWQPGHHDQRFTPRADSSLHQRFSSWKSAMTEWLAEPQQQKSSISSGDN